MQMVLHGRRTAGRTTPEAHGMRVIDPEHAPSVGIVQRQRIADAVRPIGVWRYALRHEFHPEPAADFCQKAVQVEKPLEAVVAPLHPINISYGDNHMRPRQRYRSEGD